MKISPKYGEKLIALPAETVDAALDRATKTDFKVLIKVMEMKEFDLNETAAQLGISEDEFNDSLSFWRSSGVLTYRSKNLRNEAEKEDKETNDRQDREKVSKKNVRFLSQNDDIPALSDDEFSLYLKKNKRRRQLINCCENAMGKMFNAAESKKLIEIADYLSLSDDYVELLCAHCANQGRKTMRCLESYAISFHDKGIVTYKELDRYLEALEKAAKVSTKVAKLFGAADRTLSANEKKYMESWLIDWKMPYDVIEKAYNETVDQIGKPKMAYANKILNNWYDAGNTTLAKVEAGEKEYNEAKADKFSSNGSFDTDDFFEAALKRTYGDK